MSYHNMILSAAANAGLSDSEILAAVGQGKIDELKGGGDPHPFFKAFVIAQEGTVSPRQVETGSREPIRFTRESIKSMAGRTLSKLVAGAHRIANGRLTGTAPVIGQEITRLQKDIDGKLSEIGIYYAEPDKADEMRRKKFVSFEALWSLAKSGGELVAEKLTRLYRVAAGEPGDGLTPEFPGAVELGAVTAFGGSMTLVAMAESTDWITDESLDALPEAEKKRLTEWLKKTNESSEDTGASRNRMPNTLTIEIDADSGAIRNPQMLQSLPFNTIREIVRARSVHAGQIFDPEKGDLFGTPRDTVNPETGTTGREWIGGDMKLREWCFENFVKPQLSQFSETITKLKTGSEQESKRAAALAEMLGERRGKDIQKTMRDKIAEIAQAQEMDDGHRGQLEQYLNSGLYSAGKIDPASLVFKEIDGGLSVIPESEFKIDEHVGEHPVNALKSYATWFKTNFGEEVPVNTSPGNVVPQEFRASPNPRQGDLEQY